jgi:mannose-6-phosphate isomerase-like protein (cupin superfamily)
MERRSFLKGAAAVVPAAMVPESFGQEQAAAVAPVAGQLHVVGAEADRFGGSHTLGFSTFYFKVSGAETGGRLFLMEHERMVPGGPNLHMHLEQEEWFYVIEGEVQFQIGEQRLKLGAGESVLAPRQVPHTFSAVGPAKARMMIGFSPAGKMEQLFVDKTGPNPPKRAPGFYGTVEIGPSPFLKG